MRRVLFLSLITLLACGEDAGDSPPPNILLVVIDALRFDHLSVYGYPRETSPALERLAARGWVFERHVTHGAQTVPATASLMTSQLPAEHGLVHRRPEQFRREPPYYSDHLVFLSEVLQRAGYRTAAFVGNPFLEARTGFAQGFDHFVHREKEDAALVRQARGWLRARAERGGAPFFLYLHLMGVHWPYEPPPRFARLFREPGRGRLVYANGPGRGVTPEDLSYTRATYDGAIRYVDTLIQQVLSELGDLGLRDATIVGITSDHGEEFMDHGGLGHGTTAYGELVRVPLILAHPGRLEPGRRVRHLTQHLDLAPTLLDLAGVDRPEPFRGRSLLEEPEAAFAEEGAWRAVYARGHKLLLNQADGSVALFESTDALDSAAVEGSAEIRAALREKIDQYLALEQRGAPPEGAPPVSAPRWSEQDLRRLEALGYVE